jgi:[NiFe] hydrogenase assembly HybE family chaperone
MSDKPEAQIARKLETVFNRIYKQRMSDMPMVNPQLQVHAIDFQPWQQGYLGVLSTPWFMNLMLLPGAQQDWSSLQELGKQSHSFPSGRYEFITGYEDEVGKYQMCSLFSPMFEFADDASAVETAHVIMRELMQAKNQDEAHIQPQQMEAIWNGDELPELDSETPATPDTKQQRPRISERLEQPLSRRQLLSGIFTSDTDK